MPTGVTYFRAGEKYVMSNKTHLADNSNNDNRCLGRVVLNAIPILFNLIFKMMLWDQYFYPIFR